MAYYPGCMIHVYKPNLPERIARAYSSLGYNVKVMKEWVCCGGGVLDEVEKGKTLTIAIRNLDAARKMGCTILTTSCSTCLRWLKLGEGIHQVKVAHTADLLLDKLWGTGVSVRLHIDRGTALLPGCGYITAYGFEEALTRLRKLANILGLNFRDIILGYCCCFKIYVIDVEKGLACFNTLSEKLKGYRQVVTMCPLCWFMLRTYSSLDVVLLDEIVVEELG